ncbi:MAG: HEAT repeat domain-containing protein [Deferribacteraceae bacterium]|jgi:HEAT repeat protein/anti-anti-sigma regulatory factor|nr:HEAT repeat domain-containing protein [Deferribacteraceae bacterium]
MNVTIKITDRKAYIVINPDASKKDFDDIFATLRSDQAITEVRIDLKNLFYIRSELLAQILALKKAANGKNAATYLLNVNEGVLQALEMSNLVQFFIIESDYGSYSVDILIDMFHSPEYADDISDYMSSNYSDEYKDALLKGISSEDSIVKEFSILTIGKAQDNTALEALRSGLDSTYPNVVKASILVLGWLGDMESKERFYTFIESPYNDVSEASGASIALLSEDNDPARLKNLGKSSNPDLRMVIAGTLSLINGDEAYQILSEMLQAEKVDSARPFMVRRLAFFNKAEVTETLISLLNDNSMGVQEAAAAGLERTGLRGHDAEVLKKVSSADSWVSYFAVKALGKQCSSESAKYLKEIYSQTEANVKLAIIEALGSCEDGEEFLVARLTDSNEDVRKEALSSLYRSNAARGLTEAKVLASKDSSWLVRYKAVEIIDNEKPDGYRGVLAAIKSADSNRYIQEKIASILGI